MNSQESKDLLIYAEVVRTIMLNFTDRHVDYYNYVKSLENTHPLIKHVDSWKCNTYNSLHTTDLNEVSLFQPLIQECSKQVLKFSSLYGVDNNSGIKCTSAWINLAKKDNYQEFHTHPNSHFSVAYYVKIPKNCGKITFENHFSRNNMFHFISNIENSGPVNWSSYQISPIEGELLIFRSNLYHMVEPNNSDEDRVSISMNFMLPHVIPQF